MTDDDGMRAAAQIAEQHRHRPDNTGAAVVDRYTGSGVNTDLHRGAISGGGAVEAESLSGDAEADVIAGGVGVEQGASPWPAAVKGKPQTIVRNPTVPLVVSASSHSSGCAAHTDGVQVNEVSGQIADGDSMDAAAQIGEGQGNIPLQGAGGVVDGLAGDINTDLHRAAIAVTGAVEGEGSAIDLENKLCSRVIGIDQ